ncbi:MAG: hypothetical protein JW818_17035, partial [Pirellulales bacterium]|nr:hypothetical protein [Pirellulales bacterium]
MGCTSWLSSIARPTLKPSSPLRNVFHHRLHVEPLEERQLLTVMTPYEAEYLVITADSYADEIEPLADWKQLKGVPTYVATMSDVGTTDDDIYNYISNVYSSNSDLSYVLLVGDHEDVPGYEIDDGDIWYSDYPYTCVQGGDMLPEIAVGRLSGDMGSQITTQVNKIMDYERTPDMGDWYDDALVAGYFQDLEGDDEPMDGRAARMFMETTHRTADFLGGDYDFWGTAGSSYDRYDTGYTVHTALMAQDPFDTYYYQGWSYPGRDTPPSPVPEVWTDLWTSGSQATTNISAAINGGVSLVIHRDHGSPSGWGEPHFYTSNVNALSNGDKLPVVFSINCSSGSFDTTECFAEAFMRKYNGGAVGIMAAARVSYSGYNDALALAICDGFWDNADDSWTSSTYPTSWRPAEVINRAKVRVLTGYYYSSTAKRTARLFNWFGDPEMMLRTETPSALNVSYPYSTPTGVATDFTVTVTDGVSPVQGALVCISHPTADDYWVGTTNADGEVTFTGMTPTQNGTYNVVVTEHNSVPFEGTLESMVLGGIDLMGTGFDVVPDNLHLAFGTATVSFSVRNIGDTGTGEFDLKFYLSDDATIDPATDMLLELSPSDPHSDNTEPSAYHVSGGLASMSTISDTITLVVPGQDPFGTDNDYYLGMVVDADGDVNEVNETNNQDRGQGLDQDNAEYVVSTPVVNSFDDVVAAGDGKLTLREALEACNTNTVVGDAPAGSPSQVDIITFAEGLFDSGPQTIVLN